MFKRISIRNFITFKKIEIDFEKGFTVFTGETGAGKSLLIDALMLVLGYRADTKFIRKNEDHTEIIAEFELEKKSVETNSLYQQFIFEDDGNFIFRRLIDKNGKSKSWINDTPVTLTKIRELAKNFISIYGQHSQIGLMTSEGQRFLLDEYADSAYEAKSVKDLYRQLNELKVQLAKIESDNLIFSKELEILEWQLSELKQLNLKKILKIEVNTKQVGSDRLANAISVINNKDNFIILDFGTATTFDVVLKNKYKGGIIAPGVNLSVEALYLAASRLPRLAVKPWKADMPILGKDTIGAMHSGIFWGYVSMVEGLVQRLRSDYGPHLPVISTGGLAPLFAEHVASISIVDPDLTLKGLVRIHAQNKR